MTNKKRAVVFSLIILSICLFDQITKKFIIEVKPKYQTKPPVKNPKRKTKKWYKDVENWGINSAKWKSATEYCEDQNMEFKILTEDHLNPQYK